MQFKFLIMLGGYNEQDCHFSRIVFFNFLSQPPRARTQFPLLPAFVTLSSNKAPCPGPHMGLT